MNNKYCTLCIKSEEECTCNFALYSPPEPEIKYVTISEPFEPTRTMIAAMAMQGILANVGFKKHPAEVIAEIAVKHADAILRDIELKESLEEIE